MNKVDPIVCEFSGIAPEIRTQVVLSVTGAASCQPVRCEAVWDTGSFTTVISPAVAKALGLYPLGRRPIHTANGTYWANLYSLDVMLPNGMLVQGVAVSESDLKVCDVLIGMNIISMGDMKITNRTNTKFVFRIPSEGDTPLVGS